MVLFISVLSNLLGSERSLEKLVHRLESSQEIRAPDGTVLGAYKLLTVSGSAWSAWGMPAFILASSVR